MGEQTAPVTAYRTRSYEVATRATSTLAHLGSKAHSVARHFGQPVANVIRQGRWILQVGSALRARNGRHSV